MLLGRPLRAAPRMGVKSLSARMTSSGIKSFRWGASSNSPTGYRIYWGTSAGTYPNGPHEDTGTALEEIYTALSLSADTTYYVVARAYNGYGESDNSNEIQVRNGVQIGP